jgi:hypothetical protein
LFSPFSGEKRGKSSRVSNLFVNASLTFIS